MTFGIDSDAGDFTEIHPWRKLEEIRNGIKLNLRCCLLSARQLSQQHEYRADCFSFVGSGVQPSLITFCRSRLPIRIRTEVQRQKGCRGLRVGMAADPIAAG
jgi:hypothetical protein